MHRLLERLHRGIARSLLRPALALAACGVTWAQAQLPAPPSSSAPVLRLEYDATGNVTRSVQQTAASGLGLATQHQYDKLNRRTATTDARAGVTQRDYSARDDLTALTDAINAQTGYDRDGLGQVLMLRSPDTGNTNQTFDAAGNLLTRTDARGVVSTHTYDALGRPVRLEQTGPGVDAQVFNFNYDEIVGASAHGIGRLTSISGPATYARYTYDALGRVAQQLQRTEAVVSMGSGPVQLVVNQHTTAYGYDAGGNIASIILPSGRLITYARSGGLPESSRPMRYATVTNNAATDVKSSGSSSVLSTGTTPSAVPLEK